VIRAAVAFFAFLVLARALAAEKLGLFGDEAFYFQCARRLALAYSDHPFMTAAWVRGGLELFGPTTFGTRFVFQLAGALFPFLVFWLARPHVATRRDALLAAAASLVVPATAWLGVIAIPDAPLLTFAILALGFFDRAQRAERPFVPYVLAGLATAAGLATHLRFVLVPFAFFVWLLATRRGRSEWRRAPLYVYAALALTGFLPVLLFNAALDFAPLRFQGQERHEGGASFEGFLEHVPLQMAATTPLLYVALIATLVLLVRRARRGDAGAALFSIFSLAHLLVFFLTSPIADTEHATIHWPAAGYLPLLVFLPGTLADFVAARPTRLRKNLAIAAPALGALVLVLCFLDLAFGAIGFPPLQRPFAGFEEPAARVASLLEEHRDELGEPPIVIADHYVLAGNLEQRLVERGVDCEIYVFDHLRNREHGRALQYELWERDEDSLARNGQGRNVVVVAERNQSRSSRDRPQSWHTWEPRIRSFFASYLELEPLVVRIGGGKERDFRFAIGRDVRSKAQRREASLSDS
jgi:hypothetical protein